MTNSLKEPVQLPIYRREDRRYAYHIARITALLTILFCIFVSVRLFVTVVSDWRQSPLTAADATVLDNAARVDPLVRDFAKARNDLATNAEDESSKQRIREIDRDLRARYFVHRATLVHGAYLLLGGFIVLLLSTKAMTQWGPVAPGVMTFFSSPADPWHSRTAARIAIVVAALSLVGFAVYFQMLPTPSFVVASKEIAAPAPTPTYAEFMNQWPVFRGPSGNGIATVKSAPTSWDFKSKRNIAWAVPIPLPGNNSPIVWNDKVFICGADEKTQEVYCFNAANGSMLWKQPVTGPNRPADVKPMDDTGLAAPTMATDGRRVFAIFPTGDLAAFDFDGKPLWNKSLGKIDSKYGYASSLSVYKDSVIVLLDQGEEPDAGKSAVIAFDGATGKQLWKTRRKVQNAWSSPIVIYPKGEFAGAQLVTTSNPLVAGYDAETGRELWTANLLQGDVAPSPAFAAGTVVVSNDQSTTAAIKIDGTGDVTERVAWKAQGGLPDIVSPLATPEIVLLVSNSTVECHDAKTGTKLWQQDMDTAIHASPVMVGTTIYLMDTKGLMHILEAGREFKEIGTADLDEQVVSTPAFVARGGGGNSTAIFIRGKSNLFCIKSAEAAK